MVRYNRRMNVTLRPYQLEAVESATEKLRTHRSTLIVHPTGCGKTVVFTALCDRWPGRVLVLAHRGQLVDQAAQRIKRDAGITCAIEMADQRASALIRNPSLFGPAPRVVVASVQSMALRLDEYRRDDFALIVVDEAHHAVAGYHRAVLDYFDSARVCGVSATPDRGDGVGLKAVFESVAHVVDIREAIRGKYLSPIRQRQIIVESVNVKDLSVSRKTDDFTDESIAAAMMAEEALHEVAAPLVELAGKRQTIAFCSTRAHAKALAEVLGRYTSPQNVHAVDGETDDDELDAIIERFRAKKFQFLVNCALLTEGFDAPEIEVVAICRPTKSRGLYTQMVGRGTRLAEGKKHLLVLGFVPKGAGVTLICPANVLDGNMDPDVTRRVSQLAEENPDRDVDELLTEAEEAAAEARRLQLTARAAYQVLDADDIDPFALLGVPAHAGKWGGLPATDKQIELLRANKIRTDVDKGQASALIDAMVARRTKGLCTYKQALILARYGLNPDVSFDDAGYAITTIAGNKWRVPDWLRTDARYRGKR